MRLVLILLFVIAQAFVLDAQVDLSIDVVDYVSGKGIPMVPVKIENNSIGYKAEKTTDDLGKLRFAGLLLNGTYRVTVPAFGEYQEVSRELVLSGNTDASLTLPLGKKFEITLSELVISGASRINTRNAEVASSLDQKELESLPLEGRDITRLLYRLPNVVQATGFYPEAPNVSINGSNSLFTNYLIDGMDNNERFLGGMKFNTPVGFTRNVRVLTNNFSTEYGLSANGVVDITTRSGTNDFSGEAFVITRPGAVVDASSPYAQRDLSGNQVKDGFQRYQAGVGFGGAIKKDRSFYYINLEHTTDLKDNLLRSPALGVSETVRGRNNFSYLSAKLDQVWNQHFTSAFRLNTGVVNIARQGGGLDGGVQFPSAANYQDRNSLLAAVQNTYLRDNFKSETNFQYSRFRWNYGRPEQDGSPQLTILDPQQLTIAVLGHPGYVFDATENTLQGQQKFSWYAERHTIKAGLEIIAAQHGLLGGGNVNGNYTVQLTEAQLTELRNRQLGAAIALTDIPGDVQVLNYSVELRPQSFGTTQNIYSAYLEDAYSLSAKLNLTLGLRYDYDNLSKGGSDQGDFNNLAPRFSFNYKLGQKSSLRGGYGIFYDKIAYAVYSDALQQNTNTADYRAQLQVLLDQGILPADTDLDRVTFDGNITASVSGVPYLQGPGYTELQASRDHAFSNERRILNPNGYQNPYSHQFSLGYQKELNPTVLFYADIVHNQSKNLFRLRDLNAPVAYPLDDPNNVVVRNVTAADLTRPVPIYGGLAVINGDTVRGVARNVIVSETNGEARYTGLSLNFQKDRGEDDYAFRLIYTLSKLENNTEDINFRAQDSNNFAAEWGPGINDRTHVINCIVNYYPARRLSLTLATLLQSGQPINRIPDALVYGTTDLNGDGRSFGDAYVGNSDRQPGESRNNDRLPWANTFDLAAEYRIPVRGAEISFRADVFNLFNAANLSGYSNNATQSNQIQVGPKSSGLLVRRNASAPRQIQFSAKYVF
ncbi:MAG: TonB-dependent receptor [Lewinellaceae bacterium]|nr:TonB-dependent receptor [Lewinellaceae bacterium]